MSEQPETPNSEPPETPPAETAPSLISTTPATEEAPAEDAAPAEDQQPAAPEEAPAPLTAEDISIPEGLVVPDELRDEFLGVVNNVELSPKERAQALIDLQAKAAQQASETASQAFAEQQQQWQDEVRNDPELGGAKFDATLAGISRLVDQYGNDDFVAAMAATGAGNNIHVVRFFHQIAQKLNEPAPVTGQPVAQQGDAASRLFPSMKG